MNYEQLLDEIMINTLSAERFIWFPQKDFHYAICPWTLEFHTTIFLSSILLALDQKKPLIVLIQTEELPENALLYTWKIWPHFWRMRNFENHIPKEFLENNFPTTRKNYYPYMDKLFCYLSVININPKHLVIFIKKWDENKNLTKILRKILKNNYSLLVISNCYDKLPSEICKKNSEKLIENFKNKSMNPKEKRNFSALNILNKLIPNKKNHNTIEQLINTWEIGFDTKESTSLWFMVS